MMDRESIIFDSVAQNLVVRLADGSSKTYTNPADYLAEWPDREADCVAIGWV